MSQPDALPDDIETLKAALLAERARADAAQTEAAVARAERSDAQALIVHLKLQIEKLRREPYGTRSERSARLLDQMELHLEELEATATEDELKAETAAAKVTTVNGFSRKRPSRRPFPAHLPRERIVVPGPTACPCCGGARLSKLGEDITETLEVIPRRWKVIRHVREKVSCRDCERISQPPAPFHVIARGWADPSLLAMPVFEKFGQHQPLNRQADRYAREGVPLSLSTLADQVGACCAVLEPAFKLVGSHVFAAGRLHGDDTTVPTPRCRCWQRARLTSLVPGSMCGMIARSPVRHRRRRCSTIRVTAVARTRKPIWPGMAAFFRLMPTAATPNCMNPRDSRDRSSRRRVGHMRDGSSLSWPIWRRMRSARRRVKRRRWFRR